jgi:hypothetical protein
MTNLMKGLSTLLITSAALSQGGNQHQQTIVRDRLHREHGKSVTGTLSVRWGSFLSADGTPVVAGTVTTTIGPNGYLELALEPNAGATPIGSYYTARFLLDDGTDNREYWVVPASVGDRPVKLIDVRKQVLHSGTTSSSLISKRGH